MGTSMTDTRLLISVVDDDESVRESLPDLLREMGFAARAFSSAEEFLQSDTVSRSAAILAPENRGHDMVKPNGVEASPDRYLDYLYYRESGWGGAQKRYRPGSSGVFA